MSDGVSRTVGFGVFRPNQGDGEVIVEIEVPATADAAKRRIYVTLTPAALALALTGRGGVTGEMCVYEFPKAVKP